MPRVKATDAQLNLLANAADALRGLGYSEESAQLIRIVFAEEDGVPLPPKTTMVRIEGPQLEQLRRQFARISPKATLLRVDQRGDSVAFKFDAGEWTAPMGRPQEAY